MALALSIDYGAKHGDGIIGVIDVQNGLTKWECRIPSAHPLELAISPNLESVAIATTVGIFLSKPPVFEKLHLIFERDIRTVIYSPNGAYIAATSKDYLVLFETARNEKLKQVDSDQETQDFTSLSISPSSSSIVTGTTGNSAIVWSLPALEKTHVLTEQSMSQVTSVLFVTELHLVTAGNDSRVRVWNIDLKVVDFLYDGFIGKKCLALSPSKARFAIGDQSGISIADSKSFNLIKDRKNFNFPIPFVTKISYVTDTSMLALSATGLNVPGEIKFIYTNDGGSIRKLSIKAVALQGVEAYVPSGQTSRIFLI